MFGQGRPFSIRRTNSGIRVLATCTMAVLWCLCAQVGSAQHDEFATTKLRDTQHALAAAGISTNSIRLRLSWGGGASKQWIGSVSAIAAQLSEVAPLGLTPDATVSVIQVDQRVVINHWTATNYGGVDVTLSFDPGLTPETKLRIELHPSGETEKKIEQEISVAELLTQPFNQELDTTGNRFVIARAPGDLLPVRFDREHLVFEPGETFQLGVRANLTELHSRSASCWLRLNSVYQPATGGSRNTTVAWSKLLPFELDHLGSSELQFVPIPIPQDEGVYDLQIEMTPTWQQASFRSKPSISRHVQILVLSRVPVAVDQESKIKPWRLLANIDPTQTEPTRSLTLPPFANLTGSSIPPMVGNEQNRRVDHDGESMLEMQPGGWQVLPVPVDRLDRPHLIEVEFVSDRPMAMGMSLLELDASGQIPLYGFDSGAMVPRSLIDVESKSGDQGRQWQRMVCWPHGKQPYLLIANRHPHQNCTIGKIRVLSGPDRLPKGAGPEQQPSLHSKSKTNAFQRESTANRRKFMAFYESPLFPENFGAREPLDDFVAQPLDDWQSFYVGADRLIQYLHTNGYSGAFITVASDGSAIYPSRLLGSTPKFDTGTFFSSGQDPIPKDVLEMLFRMFEREGLNLVPTLALSSPLPQLENVRSGSSSSSEQLDLVHSNRSVAARNLKSHLPVYNPLVPAVQNSVREIVDELAQRYQSFVSFRGLAIVCRPDTYTMLPGQQWGYDESTIRRYWHAHPELGTIPESWSQIQTQLMGTNQENWLQWRAEQMSTAYRDWLQQFRRSIPGGELYLAPIDLYRNEELSSALGPSLHSSVNFRRQMLRVGLDADQIASIEGLQLLKPQRIAPNQTTAANRVEAALENNRQADEFFLNANSMGDLFVHRVSWAHFAQLQEQDLFDKQLTPLMRLQQLTPAGHWNRQRFLNSLRVNDARLLVDGGPLLPMGQEQELQDLMAVFQQLPDRAFVDAKLSDSIMKNGIASLPVVVRQLQADGRTWFYAVNATPWATKVQLTIDGKDATAPRVIESLSSSLLTTKHENGITQIEFEMEPLSLVGGTSEHSFVIREYQFQLPENAADRLRKQVYVLQSKLTKSTNAQPINALKNPDFESYFQPTLGGWDFGQQSSERIQLEPSNGYQSPVSLQMKNEESEPVWIRSHPFEPTDTGRISVSVWMRTASPNQQPPLRLAIEGTLGDTTYYRFGSVGSLSPDPQSNQLSEQWQRFAVHFDNLPVERLTNLRIGFDLMGPGQVQLDHVEVFDRWFDEQDAKVITQRLAGCGPLLANPATLESCRLLLESYWLRFLDEQFDDRIDEPADELDNEKLAAQTKPQSPAQPPTAASLIDVENEPEVNSKSLFRRFRRLGGGRNQNMK